MSVLNDLNFCRLGDVPWKDPRYDPRCVELMGHIIIKKINKLKKIEKDDFYYLKISSLLIKKKIY